MSTEKVLSATKYALSPITAIASSVLTTATKGFTEPQWESGNSPNATRVNYSHEMAYATLATTLTLASTLFILNFVNAGGECCRWALKLAELLFTLALALMAAAATVGFEAMAGSAIEQGLTAAGTPERWVASTKDCIVLTVGTLVTTGLTIFAHKKKQDDNRHYQTITQNDMNMDQDDKDVQNLLITNTNTNPQDTEDAEKKSCFGLCPR